MGLISWAKGLWRMITKHTRIEHALNTEIIRDEDLESRQQLWQQMLDGQAPWNTDEIISLHLASSICREISNNTTFELEADLTGNDFLKEQFMTVVDKMSEIVSTLSGIGNIILKPFVRGNKILVSIFMPSKFHPIRYNDLEDLISVAFEHNTSNEEGYYTMLETHTWNEQTGNYRIEYRTFQSKTYDEIGNPVPITEVEEWAHLRDIEWENIKQPLFVDVRMPNKQAIFSNAVELIRLADEQYGRIVWEYEGSELAIDADIDLFSIKGTKKGEIDKPISLPKGKERLFRKLDFGRPDVGLNVFSPSIRDNNLFNGLNRHFQRIEFACALSYSIISDASLQDKTATEIRASKHRFLVTIRTIQKIMTKSYNYLAESMNTLGQLYGFFPQSNYEVILAFGDSVLDDPVESYTQRKELAAMGIISPAELRAWYLNEPLEVAQERIPAQSANSIE